MKKVTYITGNQGKLENAKVFLADYDIAPESKKLDLQEIQSDDAVAIAVQKARDAYAQLQEPLFVNDASWHIPALNGFPGPYMRYIVDWFTVEDLLKLMEGKTDRTIILRDTIVYKDQEVEKVFTNDVHGVLLEAPAGDGNGPFVTKIISLDDSGKSLAEAKTVGYTEKEKPLWQEFASWLKSA
jgi:non-canonical purine NTP pyrophosphatase (RdgB/HAM1 family)